MESLIFDGPSGLYGAFSPGSAISHPTCVLCTDETGAFVLQAQVPPSNIPPTVFEIQEYPNYAAFPAPEDADTGVFYSDLSTGDFYRFGGSLYHLQPRDYYSKTQTDANIAAAVLAHSGDASHPYMNAANVFTAANTFSGGVTLSGGNLSGSGVNATFATLTAGTALRSNAVQSSAGVAAIDLATASEVRLVRTLNLQGNPLSTGGGGVNVGGADIVGGGRVEATTIARPGGGVTVLAIAANSLDIPVPLTTRAVSLSNNALTGVASASIGTLILTGALTCTSIAASLGITAASLATSGAVNATGAITAASATITGTLGANVVNATTSVATAAVSCSGAVTAGSAAVTGAVTSASVGTGAVTASGIVSAASVSSNFLNNSSGAARVRFDGADVDFSRPLHMGGNAILTENGAISMGTGIISGSGANLSGDAIAGRLVTTTLTIPGGADMATMQPSVSTNGGTREMIIQGRLRFGNASDDTYALYRFSNELHLVGGGSGGSRQVRVYDILDAGTSMGAPTVRTNTVLNSAGSARMRFNGTGVDVDTDFYMNSHVIRGLDSVVGSDGSAAFNVATAGQVQMNRAINAQTNNIYGVGTTTTGTIRVGELQRADGTARLTFSGGAIDVRTDLFMGGHTIRQATDVYSAGDDLIAMSFGGPTVTMGRPLNMAGYSINTVGSFDGLDPKDLGFSRVQTFTTLAGSNLYTYTVPGGLGWRIMSAMWIDNSNGNVSNLSVCTDTSTSCQLDRIAGLTIRVKLIIDRNGP